MRVTQAEVQLPDPKQPASIQNIVKFTVFSLIGIFAFFVPITINGSSSIPLDHMVTFVRNTFTNHVFKEGKYSIKEAVIIATGFSTVSVTFMVVIAKQLELMEIWNTYFWVTLIVTFIVTAITVRIWPLSRMSEEYYENKADPEEVITENRFKVAWGQAMEAVEHTPSLMKNIWINLRDGVLMAAATLPTILSVGLLRVRCRRCRMRGCLCGTRGTITC